MYPDDNAPAARPVGEKSDLLPRLLSGIVMVIIALICLKFGGWFWFALVAGVCILIAAEWVSMTTDNAALSLWSIVLAALLVATAFSATYFGSLWTAAALGAVSLVLLVYGLAGLKAPVLWFAGGLLYFGLTAIALIWLRGQPSPNGALLVLFLFIVVWATDIGAYFVGRMMGGPKIFPSISPKKTWSGSIGGVIIAALCILPLKGQFDLLGSYPALALAAVMLSMVAQAGDAIESALKRTLGVKDSGSTIPGHGGILDRIDGLLLAAPVFALIVGL